MWEHTIIRGRSNSVEEPFFPIKGSHMRHALSTLFVCVSVGLVASADTDPVKEKLEAAEKAHVAELKRANQSVLDSFDEREKTARNNGNKKLVDQIKEERTAFIESAECPLVSLLKFEQQLSVAHGRMIAAYKSAIRDYTKAKKDDTASAVEISLESFQRDRWKAMNVEKASVKDDFLQLDDGSITTKIQVSGPFEVVAVARTAGKSIRFGAYSGSCVIFNWENNIRELRVARPDGGEKPESGSVATARAIPLKLNTWYLLRWRVTSDRIETYVNEKLIFVERRAHDLSGKGAVSISMGGRGDVRYVRVVNRPNKAE